MLSAFHSRIAGHRQHDHLRLESALVAAGAMILTLLTVIVLFLFVFASRAV